MVRAISERSGKPDIASLTTYWQQLKNRKRKNNMKMDFIVDKETKTVSITKRICGRAFIGLGRIYASRVSRPVVGAKTLDIKNKGLWTLRVGGRRFYAMVSPDGHERWVVQKYTSITPKTNFKLFNAFADEDENPELPGSDWDLNFSEQDGTTRSVFLSTTSRWSAWRG